MYPSLRKRKDPVRQIKNFYLNHYEINFISMINFRKVPLKQVIRHSGREGFQAILVSFCFLAFTELEKIWLSIR